MMRGLTMYQIFQVLIMKIQIIKEIIFIPNQTQVAKLMKYKPLFMAVRVQGSIYLKNI